MKHLPGGRTSAVMMCPACSHTFEAVFCEPLGKEGRALRAAPPTTACAAASRAAAVGPRPPRPSGR